MEGSQSAPGGRPRGGDVECGGDGGRREGEGEGARGGGERARGGGGQRRGSGAAAKRVPTPRLEDGRVAGLSIAAEMAALARARARARGGSGARGLEVEARAVRGGGGQRLELETALLASGGDRGREGESEPRSGGRRTREGRRTRVRTSYILGSRRRQFVCVIYCTSYRVIYFISVYAIEYSI